MPIDIAFLGLSIVRKKFRLTVVYLIFRMQNSQGKITPLNKCDIPTGIQFLRLSTVCQKFQLTLL